MSLKTVRTKMAEKLGNINGLKAFAYPPNNLPQLPCAIVGLAPDAADYQEPGDTTIWRLFVLLLLASYDADKAYNEMDDYLEKTGEKSIKANLESGTDAADYVVVQRVQGVGPIAYRAPGQLFYGAEFVVEAGDTT